LVIKKVLKSNLLSLCEFIGD